MIYLLPVILFLLSLALLLSVIRSELWIRKLKIFRISVSILGLLFAVGLFLRASIPSLSGGESLRLVNKLPQAVDFYILQPAEEPGEVETLSHTGIIRPEHFMQENVDFSASRPLWVVGYLGKNMVHFSKRIPSGTETFQEIEVKNYMLQKRELIQKAEAAIHHDNQKWRTLAIEVSLLLLLVFLNFVILLRKAS